MIYCKQLSQSIAKHYNMNKGIYDGVFVNFITSVFGCPDSNFRQSEHALYTCHFINVYALNYI